MNWSKWSFLLLFLWGTAAGFSQVESKIVSGTIIDAKTSEALVGATVLNLQTGEGTVSNAKGQFSLAYEDDRSLLSVQYLGYFSQSIPIKEFPKRVAMKTNSELIDELTIYAERIPQDLTVRYETIRDFVISEDRILMLSKRNGKSYVLKLADLDGKVLHTQALPNIKKAEELFTSCFGTNFLVGEFHVLQLHTSQDSIFIIDKDTRKRFKQFIEPCRAQTEDYVYLENKSKYKQVSSIMAYHRKKEEAFVFAKVDDKENLARLPYDKRYMDYANGEGPLYLGVHASHSPDPAVNARSAAQWGTLLNRSFYLPVDFFLLSKQDSILLFDHEKHKLIKYTQEGEKLEQYALEYSQQDGWKSKDNILLDLARNDLYAVQRQGSKVYFTRINTINGKDAEQYSVHASFVEKMIIHNGVLYFTNSSLVPGQGERILKRVELQ